MEKLKDIDTFYSQKVIPLAFNESLSYMEQICNLISYIENTLVPAINNNANAIKELQEYVQELKKLLDKLEQKVDENFITLNTKIDTTKEELNTKIDTTKEELNTKINTTKEELTNIINGINTTLTNAIQNLDTKVVEHINTSNEKFNALDTSIETINTNIETINTNIGTINANIEATNTEVGTIKEQIQTIDTNVNQNTNDITNLKKNGLNWNTRQSSTNYVTNARANLTLLQLSFATNSTLTYISVANINNPRFNFLSFSEGDYIPYLNFNTKFEKKCFPQDSGIALIQDTVTNIVYSCPCSIDEFPQTITIKVNCSQLKGNTNELKFLGMTGILLFNR